MSENNQITTNRLELKRRSRRLQKAFNLLDFVVIKTKNKKTNKIKHVKVSKQIQKRGKVRKKKITTIKKRLIKERHARKNLKLLNELPTQPEIISDVCYLSNTIQNIQLSDEKSPAVPSSMQASNITHSRNFREYCNHFITKEIKELMELILKSLFKFQENKFQQNPVRARAKRRYVVGLKEVKKFLAVKRLKLIFIAPDLEKSVEIDDVIAEIKGVADQHSIPYVFGVKRRHLGYLLLKKVPISIVGIFDYQGVNENVTDLLMHVEQEKINYKNKLNTFS